MKMEFVKLFKDLGIDISIIILSLSSGHEATKIHGTSSTVSPIVTYMRYTAIFLGSNIFIYQIFANIKTKGIPMSLQCEEPY